MSYPGLQIGGRRTSNVQHRPQQYRVGPMMTATSVGWALSNTALTRDPEYVKAVIRSYVQAKAANGRSKAEIGYKLEYLEEDYLSFGPSFIAVRQEYGLPPSCVIRPPPPRSSAATTSAGGGTLRRAQTSTASTLSAPAAPNISRTRTTTGATTTRPVNPDETEPPPPPYTTQDPEPEATRMLQERLAAEAEAAGSVTADSIPATAVSAASSQAPARTPSVASPRPSSVRNPPANQSTPSTPARATSSRPQAAEDAASPPSDPEMARVWEESQLAEAKRASLAWQREQEELQEAMRLSLAEAESHAESSSAAQAQAGPSNPNRRQMSAVEEEDDQPLSSLNSRRVSSYHPLATAQANPHRRVASDATGALEQPIPGGWHTPTSTAAGNLIDEDEMFSGRAHAPLTPNKTGHALQSNNPFLSPTEREHLEAESHTQHSALDDLADLRIGDTASATAEEAESNASGVPQNHEHENPGSSYTTYRPGGPDSPHEQYAPPPGPPPPHLKITTPPAGSPTSRPLPRTPTDGARTRTETALPPPLLPPRPSQSQSGIATLQLQRDGGEDPLETLKEYDTVFLVDDSTSMAGDRWSQARAAIMEVAEIAARYDEDGVDVYFINSKRVGKELRAASDVEDLFRGLEPKGATPTGLRIEAILREYMARLERSALSSPGLDGQPTSGEHVKPMNLIVVTDGAFALPVLHRKRSLATDLSIGRNALLDAAPTDDPESVLIACAKRLDKGDYPLSQVGVQFLQIGDDSEAREALEELDDGLSSTHGVRDMIDTVPYTGEDMSARLIIKTLLGGINRRMDRRG